MTERGDELGELAADFNSMADRLRELMIGRESLLREMSHELRSPLARLQAALALAAERETIAADERDRIEQEIGRMNRVIGEMLSYASLDVAAAPRKQLVRIGKLLQELVTVEELEARSHHCRLQLNAEPALTVLGDQNLLNSGLENVLRNAIRYAPDDSVVSIDARAIRVDGSAFVEIAISDSGPGVPEEHLENIFEPYFRISSGNHHQDSTGLGLAIVRRVTEQHNGTVTASSRPGGGLTVTLRFPAV